MIDLRIRVFIILGTRHTRVAIAQKVHTFQAKDFCGAIQFMRAQFRYIFESFKMFFIHRSHFAARCADIIGVIAFFCVKC